MEEKLRDLEMQFKEFQMIAAPIWVQNQIQDVINTQVEFYNQLKELQNYVDQKLEEMVAVKKANIEEISDKELIDLWKSSGVSLQEIADKFVIQVQTASLWVNGKTKDAVKRDQLRKFLLEKMK